MTLITDFVDKKKYSPLIYWILPCDNGVPLLAKYILISNYIQHQIQAEWNISLKLENQVTCYCKWKYKCPNWLVSSKLLSVLQ